MSTENLSVPLASGQRVPQTDAEVLQGIVQHCTDALEKLSTAVTTLSNPQQQDAAVTRANKLERLYSMFLKQNKLKEFKPHDSIDARQWLEHFDEAIESLAIGGCGLDLANAPLTAAEFVRLLKAKLSFHVQSEIRQALQANNTDWDTADIVQVRTAMLGLYMRRVPDVSSVLKLFSQDRIKKGSHSVAEYYAKFKANLPPSLNCTTDAQKAASWDMFMRSAFYYGLDCAYLQKELSNIKEEDQSLKAFLDEAIAAEGRALHYKDTLNRGHALDSSMPSETTGAK